jgi:hypothetical protein
MDFMDMEFGFGVAIAFLVIKELFIIVKKLIENRDPTSVVSRQDTKLALKQIEQLWNWHNKTDQDGVPVWYVRKSLEDVIYKLSENIEAQNRLVESNTRILESLVEKISEMKKGGK